MAIILNAAEVANHTKEVNHKNIGAETEIANMILFVLMCSVILMILSVSSAALVTEDTFIFSEKGEPVPNGKEGKDPKDNPVNIFDKLTPGKYTPTDGIPYTVEKPDDVRN